MPKIHNYNESTEETISTQLANPQLWGWNTPTMHPVKEINGYRIVGDFNDTSHTLYGLFQNGSNDVLSAIDIKLEPGKNYNIPIENVAVVENVATVEKERGKGYARILYEYIINKFKVLVSDIKIFTSGNTYSKTLSIWSTYLPTISKVFNYNTKTKTYYNFDVKTGDSEDFRFVAVKDENIANKLTESLKKLALKGAAGLAFAGAGAGAIGMGVGNNELDPPANRISHEQPAEKSTDNFQTYYNAMSQLKDKPEFSKYTLEQPPQSKPQLVQPVAQTPQKSNKIDVNIISQIESSGSRKAISKDGHNTRGICQIGKPAWDETQKKLFGKIKYPFEKYAFNTAINKQTADHYYNKILPGHLDSFGLPITTETLIASYNHGSSKVKILMKKYGKHWKKYLPEITKNYIDSYKNLSEN